MVQFLCVLMLFFSIVFVNLSHPVSMGLFLLIHTTLVGIIAGGLIGNFWFSYVLFLVFLGGVLVLFIYMTSLASNQKFELNWNILGVLISVFVTMILGLPLLMSPSIPLTQDWIMSMHFNEQGFEGAVSKIYDYLSCTVTLILITYLLFTLLVCVNIASGYKGALRNFN